MGNLQRRLVMEPGLQFVDWFLSGVCCGNSNLNGLLHGITNECVMKRMQKLESRVNISFMTMLCQLFRQCISFPTYYV